MKRVKIATCMLFFVSLVSCTSFNAFRKGREYETAKDWDKAVIQYTKALEVDPENNKYKIALQKARREASRAHFDKGRQFKGAGRNDLAAIEFELVTRLDPTNQYAAIELVKAVEALQAARNNGRTIDDMKKKAKLSKAQPPQLNPASADPISLSFPRPTPVKEIYRSLGNAFGINVVFDQAVKDDERISIELRDVTAQQALERVMQGANHFYKVLDEKTIIVVPDNPQNRRDYEDLVIQTFYLSNGDAEQVTNVVRTMIEARNVFPLKALNAITIRDTADKVKIAEKIIEANDKAKAEVVVDVELLQLDATRARDLGLQLVAASGGSFNPIVGQLLGSDGKAVTSLKPGDIGDIAFKDFSFTIPSIAYGFVKSNTDAQLLAKPQLRISESEKATLLIGQRIPVPVSTFTSANPGTGGNTFAPVTSYQYSDVGIKIAIEPRVHHNREVTLKLTVEVSNLSGFAPDTNPPQPIIGTRTIESTIRLKDGETNFLAGLIRKDDSTSTNTIPFLGDIPILGRFFSRDRKDGSSTDLVLTMTPHIIRVPDVTEDDLAPMWVGTTNNLTFRGVSPRIESGAQVDPFNSPGVPEAPAEEPPGDQEMQIEGMPSNVTPAPAGTPPSDPFKPPVKPVSNSLNMRAAPAERDLAALAPQIAPEPTSLQIRAGEEKVWTIVGMHLAGLMTNEIRLRYDPSGLDVLEAMVGTAFEFDPIAPPAAAIDRTRGIVRVVSVDGRPLKFRSGGDVLALKVRGLAPEGGAILVLDIPALVRADGELVSPIVTGGRTKIN